MTMEKHPWLIYRWQYNIILSKDFFRFFSHLGKNISHLGKKIGRNPSTNHVGYAGYETKPRSQIHYRSNTTSDTMEPTAGSRRALVSNFRAPMARWSRRIMSAVLEYWPALQRYGDKNVGYKTIFKMSLVGSSMNTCANLPWCHWSAKYYVKYCAIEVLQIRDPTLLP